MIGWCGFFLVNAQIKPFLYCIAISWYSLLLNLQPFTVLGSFLGGAGIVLFRGGFRAFLYLVGDLYADHQLSFFWWHAGTSGCVIGL